MLSKRIILYISSTIVLLSDNGVVTASEHRTACVYPTEPNFSNVTKYARHQVKIAEVGESNITDEFFTERMKEILTGDKKELLCSFTMHEDFTEIPGITCREIYSPELDNILQQLNTDYEDSNFQNELLNYVWSSKVGERMLEIITPLFRTVENAKLLVKDMWFYHDEAHEVMLFPNVFLGYELHKTKYGRNLAEHEKLHDNEAFTLVNGIMRKQFPYNTAPVSWTGIFFRKRNYELNFVKGVQHPLVQNSIHLAEVNVSMHARDRESTFRGSTFILGTSFLYDFVAFTMCWLYRGMSGKCVTPLPGNTDETVDITRITIESYAGGSTMDDIVLEVHCVGFKISEHFPEFSETDWQEGNITVI